MTVLPPLKQVITLKVNVKDLGFLSYFYLYNINNIVTTQGCKSTLPAFLVLPMHVPPPPPSNGLNEWVLL